MEQPPQVERRPLVTQRFLVILAFITVSIAWGTTYAGIKVAVRTFPPFTLVGIRFLVAGIVLMAVLRAMGIRLPGREDWKRIIPVGVLLLTCANGFLGWAQQYVESVFAALMVNSGPFIFVGWAAVFGERIPKLAWGGLVVGFIGLVVLVSPQLHEALSTFNATSSPWFWWAVAALVVGPFCWSTGSFLAHKRPAKCHPLMIAAAQNIAGGCGGVVIALLAGETSRMVTPDRASLLAVLYLLVVGSWLGYVSYMYVVMRLPPHRSATTTYLNAVVAVLVGWLFMGEEVTLNMIVGGGIVLFGVYVVNKARAAVIQPRR